MERKGIKKVETVHNYFVQAINDDYERLYTLDVLEAEDITINPSGSQE